MTVHNNSRW